VTSAEIKISPKARRLAKDRGVDITRLKGSGGGGEILAEDILAAAESGGAAAVGHPIEPLTSTGRLMAERTTQSWTRVPHFFLTRDVDATGLNAVREVKAAEADRTAGIKVTHTDLLVSFCATALSKHPRMNASWTGDAIKTNPAINVALAMAVDNAVVTAVVHHADKLSIAEIAARRRELTERSRASKLQPADITGATFTISNLGMYHIDRFTAIIVPPQAGILAVGAIADRVVAVDGKPAVRPMMTLTLSCDHRVVDGARGAEFLNDVVEGIQTATIARS
jgi:pyruvate dehydrogenase E2 component (dihydrolipoamide acetyltransferase)